MQFTFGEFGSVANLGRHFPALLAQAQSSGGMSWAEVLHDMEVSKLVILLIFGTGLVSAIGYAVSGMIRAYHAAPDESEELSTRISALEKRIGELEQQQNSSVV